MTEAQSIINFIENFLVYPDGEEAGEPFVLREFQKDYIRQIFAEDEDGNLTTTMALVLLPRKQGKTLLTAAIVLYYLLKLPGKNNQLYAAAGVTKQAELIFNMCKDMIALAPELGDRKLADGKPLFEVLYGNNKLIRCNINGNVFKVLSGDAGAAHGLKPALAIIDELHEHPNGKLTEALISGQGVMKKRAGGQRSKYPPLTIIITTPSAGEDNYLYEMVQQAKRVREGHVADPGLVFIWDEPPQKIDHRDPEVWKRYIPGLDDWNPRSYYEGQVERLPENEFRRLHLAQWTNAKDAFLPYGVWDGLERSSELKPRTAMVLGVDGAWSNDSTAIVGCTLDGRELHVLGYWQRPADAPDSWHTPFDEVEDTIRELCELHNVRAVVMDPYWLAQTYTNLDNDGYPVEVFRTNQIARIIPATQAFYTACLEGSIKHDGSPVLASHINNAYIKSDRKGMRIDKEYKGSPRKIDAAVAAVMALFVTIELAPPMAKPCYSYI